MEIRLKPVWSKEKAFPFPGYPLNLYAGGKPAQLPAMPGIISDDLRLIFLYCSEAPGLEIQADPEYLRTGPGRMIFPK